MMKARQFFAIAASAVLSVGVVSCGDSESGSASTRVTRILKYVDDGKYDEAVSYFSEHDLKKGDLSDLSEAFQTRIQTALDDYANDKIEYDAAYKLISCAQRMNIPDLLVPLSEASTKLGKLNTSKEQFRYAKQYFENGEYTYALQCLGRISEDDQNYTEAQNIKTQCLAKYKESLEENVKNYTKGGEYRSAISYLKNCRYSVSDSKDATELIDKMIADIGVDGVIKEAQADLDQGDLNSALSKVDKFEEDYQISDSRLDDFSKKAKEDYLTLILKKAEELSSQTQYASALKMIENAQEVISDKKLDELKEKILAVKPTYLSDLYLTNSKEYTLIESGDPLVDTVGNTYPVGNLYSIRGNYGYGEYNLGYRYNRLYGTIATQNRSGDRTATLKIIGDDVTLYSVEIKRAMTPVYFDVDISSVNWLKISMTDGSYEMYAILADCTLGDAKTPETTTTSAAGTAEGDATTTTAE